MKFLHTGCGGTIRELMEIHDAGYSCFKCYFCVWCGKEFEEGGINDLYLHGHVTPIPTPGDKLDAVMMQGFADIKKAHDEPRTTRRIRYPKKTRRYRRKSRSSQLPPSA